VYDFDELQRLQLHVDEHRIDFRAEVAVENHARHRDDETEGGVVERDGNALCEHERITALRRLGAEDLDHADDGAEKAEQRTDGCDRPECGEKTLQLERDRASGLLDRFLHDHRRAADIAKTRGKDLAERGLRREPSQHLGRDTVLPVLGDDLRQELPRDYGGAAQRPAALADDRKSDHGT
jgi:hypothetical protein